MNKRKRSKNKRQTSNEIFTFAFAFARSERSLKETLVGKMHLVSFWAFQKFHSKLVQLHLYVWEWTRIKNPQIFFCSENRGYTRVYWDIILSSDFSLADIDVAIRNFVNNGSTLPGTSAHNAATLSESYYYQCKFSATCFVSCKMQLQTLNFKEQIMSK